MRTAAVCSATMRLSPVQVSVAAGRVEGSAAGGAVAATAISNPKVTRELSRGRRGARKAITYFKGAVGFRFLRKRCC